MNMSSQPNTSSSGAIRRESARQDAIQDDPDLTAINNAWDSLPAAIKAAMVAMVKSSIDGSEGDPR